MKVLIVNGSPNKNGCTSRAIMEVCNTLSECGIESEIFNIGNGSVLVEREKQEYEIVKIKE